MYGCTIFIHIDTHCARAHNVLHKLPCLPASHVYLAVLNSNLRYVHKIALVPSLHSGLVYRVVSNDKGERVKYRIQKTFPSERRGEQEEDATTYNSIYSNSYNYLSEIDYLP